MAQSMTQANAGHFVLRLDGKFCYSRTMERNKFVILTFLFCGLVQASAITFQEIAGTYEGWRTETTAGDTIRYGERDEILPDGSFYTWLTDEENGIVYTMFSVLTLDEDGNITGPYAGILKIQGRHLSINYRIDAHNAVHASTRRID